MHARRIKVNAAEASRSMKKLDQQLGLLRVRILKGSDNGGSGSGEERVNTGNLKNKTNPEEIILLEKGKGKAESKTPGFQVW